MARRYGKVFGNPQPLPPDRERPTVQPPKPSAGPFGRIPDNPMVSRPRPESSPSEPARPETLPPPAPEPSAESPIQPTPPKAKKRFRLSFGQPAESAAPPPTPSAAPAPVPTPAPAPQAAPEPAPLPMLPLVAERAPEAEPPTPTPPVEEPAPAPQPARRPRLRLGLGRRVKVTTPPLDAADSPPDAAAPTAPPPEPEQPPEPASPPPPRMPRLPLRIALDLRTWEMSGLGTYVREFLAAFARLGLPVQWTFIGPEELREKLPQGLVIERWHDFNAPIYDARSFFAYPKLRDVDLFHYPHYNLPRVRAPHTLVSVFDLFHLHYGSWPKRQYQRFFLRRLHWSHAHLLTACEKVSRELSYVGHIPEDRVSVIPLGPGRSFASPSPDLKPPVINSLAGTPLNAPWMLVTGIDQPHKNFDFLLSALSLYFQRQPNAPPLVWVGLTPEGCQKRARQLPAQIRQRIALEPYSDPQRFEAIFRGAMALLFPSLDEGFGFPPLEAMCRGVPVICARREPMTTILGNGPLFFEPTETASLWRMLDRLLDSREVWEEVSARGRQRAAHYSWDWTAKKMLKLYAQLIMKGQP